MELTIYGKPQGKGRPRFNYFNRHAYTPEKTERYESDIKWAYLQKYSEDDKFIDRAIKIEIRAYFERNKGEQKKRLTTIFYIKKPDCDNIAKIVLDALNGLAYDDDARVTNLQVYKRYGEPRLEISITEDEQSIG